MNEILDLSRSSLEKRLAQQWQSRQNVRTLSLNLLGAHAVTVTLFVTLAAGFGGKRREVDLTFAVVETALFAIAVVCSAAILWSKTLWIYGTSGSKVYLWSSVYHVTNEEIGRRIVIELMKGQDDNEKLLVRHALQFRLQISAFGIATAAGPLFAIFR